MVQSSCDSGSKFFSLVWIIFSFSDALLLLVRAMKVVGGELLNLLKIAVKSPNSG